ncbi:WxL protein host-binding domain-containing protein, partial [Lacticaseibacillus paracasei]
SHFDYALPSKEALSPGTYTLDLTAKAVGKTWHWRRNFTITRQQSEAIEQKLGRETPQKPWLWIIIAIVLALVILVLLWLVWRQRRKGRETDETKEN